STDTAKPFFNVSSAADARFFALCFLLKQKSGTPEFTAAVEKTRAEIILPVERLRFEQFLYDLYQLDSGRESLTNGFLKKNIGTAVCLQNTKQTIKELARNGNTDWQPAAFSIILTEIVNNVPDENIKLTKEQKTEFLVNVWCSCAETKPAAFQLLLSDKLQLLTLLNPQQTERVKKAFDTFTKKQPEMLIQYAAELNRRAKEESFTVQLRRLQQAVVQAADISDAEQQKRVNETAPAAFNTFLTEFDFVRYGIFVEREEKIWKHSVEDLRNEISYSDPTPAAEEVRQLIGLEKKTAPVPLSAEQEKHFAELEQGLQMLAAFAVEMSAAPEPETAQDTQIVPKPLDNFLPELTGSRTVDRSLLRSVLDGKAYFAELTSIESLLYRTAFLYRAVDEKTKSQESNFAKLLYLLEQKQKNDKQSTVCLLNILQELNGSPNDKDAEYHRLAQQLVQNKQRDAAETLALALLEVKEQHFDKVMPLLDSIAFKTPQDLRAREFIAATLGIVHRESEAVEQKRTAAALDNLLNFPLSDQELFQLLPLLEKTKRTDDAKQVLAQLSATAVDRRIQNELLHRLQDADEEQKDNAVLLARRVLRHSGYFINSQHFVLDSYIFCTAARILKKYDMTDSVIELLEKRCMSFQGKKDGMIVLAQLYLIFGKQEKAKELAVELANNPPRDSERRNAITALLQHFEMKKELEEMNQRLLENSGR
ncbi:MAG: hypothetical protein LBN39_01680, partial [Planctomycetaceae bacterium]|nr:hypothetical protein [Planctomycetaceae bacterium]